MVAFSQSLIISFSRRSINYYLDTKKDNHIVTQIEKLCGYHFEKLTKLDKYLLMGCVLQQMREFEVEKGCEVSPFADFFYQKCYRQLPKCFIPNLIEGLVVKDSRPLSYFVDGFPVLTQIEHYWGVGLISTPVINRYYLAMKLSFFLMNSLGCVVDAIPSDKIDCILTNLAGSSDSVELSTAVTLAILANLRTKRTRP